MSSVLASVHRYIVPLHTSIHPYIPFTPLDIFGAIRLSQIISWISTGTLGNEPSSEATRPQTKGIKTRPLTQPGALQECLGILMVLFGGETFLGETSSIERKITTSEVDVG
jgi:hypothetical protein